MKRWVVLTIVLYLLCLSVFTVPLLLFLQKDEYQFITFFYLCNVPILLLIHSVLLLIPIDVVRERPVKRRKIIASMIIGAVPMGFLAVGFLTSILFMVFGENASAKYVYDWPFWGAFLMFWLLWGVIFWKSSLSRTPDMLTSFVTQWLLRGSILELLVAIPSHIISRQREECCAPAFTLLGIATGLSIALMSFGPGIYFLFVKRIKQKKKQQG